MNRNYLRYPYSNSFVMTSKEEAHTNKLFWIIYTVITYHLLLLCIFHLREVTAKFLFITEVTF
jgi:hypothetical protein